MDFLQKVSAFVIQTNGSLHSGLSLYANIIATVSAFFLRNTISAFYVTLHDMNYPVATIIFWLSIATAYGVIYRVVCVIGGAISHMRLQKKHSRNVAHREAILMQNVYSLSKNEIAVLKFFLILQPHAAWLPCKHTLALILRNKGIILPVAYDTKDIPPLNATHNDAPASAMLFFIPEHVLHIIHSMPEEISQFWLSIPPDTSLELYQ